MSALRQDIRRFFGLLRPERRNYAIGLTSLFLVNLFDVAAPLFLALAIDLVAAEVGGPSPTAPPALAAIGVNAATATYGAAILAFLALQLGANLFRYPMLMFTAVPSHRIGRKVRNDITAHLLRLSSPFFDRAKSGDLMSRATNDVHQARMMFGPAVVVGSDTIIILSLVILVMLSLSWQLTLVAMAPVPIIGFVTNWLSHAEYDRWEDVQEDMSELTERARESFAGIRVVQAYAREAFDRRRFAGFSRRHLGKQLRLARVRSLFMPTLDLMTGLSTALILLVGGLQVVRGTLSVGTFVAFLFLIGFVSGPMMGFGWAVSLIQRGRASLRRIDTLLAENVDIVEAQDPLPVDGPIAVSIRGLTFTYPTPPPAEGEDDDRDRAPVEPVDDEGGVALRPALRNVSLEIAPGETLGVIGAVGSGKSTLASLLVRLYDPPRGTVFIDGVDVRDVSLDGLREAIVVAPQETFLFSDTVERNILMAADEGSSARSFAALAALDTELDALKHGYDTMLGERGVNLSGGQRQRLAIARSIAADPKFLVLDDCLSAVDAKTEEAILGKLRDVFAERSGIIISHRVCAVQGCDRIAVLDDGEVREEGTHAELIARGGAYARIAAEQGVDSVQEAAG